MRLLTHGLAWLKQCKHTKTTAVGGSRWLCGHDENSDIDAGLCARLGTMLLLGQAVLPTVLLLVDSLDIFPCCRECSWDLRRPLQLYPLDAHQYGGSLFGFCFHLYARYHSGAAGTPNRFQDRAAIIVSCLRRDVLLHGLGLD